MSPQQIRQRCAVLVARAERWAEANPGREYRKTVIWDDQDRLTLSTVSRWFYEEACMESDYFGEVFALKEAGKPVYSSLEVSA